MPLQELETQLLTFTPGEKAQVIQTLMQTIAQDSRCITKTPGICGGAACITNTRMPVWGLVEARRLGHSEVDLLTSYPTLTATDLTQTWIYAETDREEIEATMQVKEVA
jgi:uncharacterized protein (DUF433 family)